MASELLKEFATHKPLIEAKVKIDLVFAYSDPEKEGSCALKHHGCRALGIARKIDLKQRSLGRGDAEICLDADWWAVASDAERRALLDHELHHLKVKEGKHGYLFDDLKRPLLGMRKHDFEFGWFKVIAERHGAASGEQHQAREMMNQAGQLFWPEIFGSTEPPQSGKGVISRMTISGGGHSVVIDHEGAKKIKASCDAILGNEDEEEQIKKAAVAAIIGGKRRKK